MRILPGSLSLRARLLLAGVLVNVVMLALLIANSISVVDKKFDERMRIHLEEQRRLLNAALSVPLSRNQYKALSEILEQVRADDGITYLVLFDHQGRRVASTGWEETRPLPPAVTFLKGQPAWQGEQLHAAMDIEAAGIKIGRLHFGLSTEFMRAARAALIRENLAVGVAVLILSVLSLVALSFWLTRNLAQLTTASESLAAGDLNVRLPVEGG
jgi:methyl-accepting chemotaxis protein